MGTKGLLIAGLMLATGAACAQDFQPLPLDEYGAAPGYPSCEFAGCTNALNANADIDLRIREADGKPGFAVMAKDPGADRASTLVQFILIDTPKGHQESVSSCRLNDSPAFDVVAIGIGKDGQGSIKTMTHAWKLDASGKLAPTETAGLSCLADSQLDL